MLANLPELQRLSIHMIGGILHGPRPTRHRHKRKPIRLSHKGSAREGRSTTCLETRIGVMTPSDDIGNDATAAVLAKRREK